ncbi:OmpA family protein [Shewanella fidelis]|uniref:OmpA family protein n=1 Tax=Shewanella fidelis TaxID=173509 RepID=UPI0004B90912|nr:OmpA family protein [Shewanella fidelis]
MKFALKKMSSMKVSLIKSSCFVSILLLCSDVALAESFYSDGDFYFGGKIGGVLLDTEKPLEPGENKTVNLSSGLTLGYNINSYLSVETDMSYLGQYQDESSAEDKNLFAVGAYLSTRYRLSDDAALYVKLGPAWVEDNVSLSSGLGIKYRLSPNWELDSGYRWIKDTPSTDDDLYEFTLGINYKFGVVSHQPARPVVNQIHKKQTAVAATSTTSMMTTSKPLSISAKSLFGFDSSKLIATAELTEVLKQVKASKDSELSITAYTDNLGTEEYNLALSKLRAEATRNYFIANGVEPSRIQIDWKGEAAPISSNLTDSGRMRNRRVEIELN